MRLIKALDSLHLSALCLLDIKKLFDESLAEIESKIINNASLKSNFTVLSKQVNDLTKKIHKKLDPIQALNQINLLVSVIYESKRVLTISLDYIENKELTKKINKILKEINEIITTNY